MSDDLTEPLFIIGDSPDTAIHTLHTIKWAYKVAITKSQVSVVSAKMTTSEKAHSPISHVLPQPSTLTILPYPTVEC